MKKIGIFLVILFCISSTNAQININPDPYGDPWLVGGVPEITPEIQSDIDAISEFRLDPSCLMNTLSSSVDNSQRQFMRDIFRQNGNSCAQASTVGYMFTYEIDYLRNIAADRDSSRYHPAFTYNFLNYGSPDSGSRIDHGLRILEEMGCPSIRTYGKSIQQADSNEWISGYDKYDSALRNRITGYEAIDMVSDSGLFFLKHWLADHNSDDTVGGLAVFAVKNMQGCIYEIIEEGPETDKSIITSCTTTVITDAHALTFVGYNDSIRFDVDNSGTYEENELGAFKVANSWGFQWPYNPPNFPDSGYCYILYSLFSDDSVFLNGVDAYICNAIADYYPEINIKAKMTHPNRRWFFNQLGSDTLAGKSAPSALNALWPVNGGRSGEFPLTGLTAPDDTLEIAIDFSYFLNHDPSRNLGKIFFRPWTTTPYKDDGILWYGSMFDNRWGEVFELPLSNIPDTMEASPQWKFSVDYDLLPFAIERDTLLVTDQIYRLSDTIRDGATLTIGSGHSDTELHLHDAELLIEEGSSLYLSSWSWLIAKSGTNKIIVKGNLIIDPDATIKSEGNATLEIYFENDTLNSHFTDCTFENVTMTGFSHALTISDSHLSGFQLDYSSGDLVFSGNTCFNSTLKAYHPLNSSSFCSITDNKIDNNNNTPGWSVITIEDYPSFVIQNDTIQYNFDRGVELFYAGREARGVHSIENNIIQFTGFPLDSVAELGIHAYYSDVNIYNNKIQYNDYGITGFHRSEMTVLGDPGANGIDDTQLIGDNNKCQCLFNISTFPTEFHWNVVRDVSSQDRPFIKVVEFDEMIEDTTAIEDWIGDPVFDVESNCWVNDTNPENRLVPVGAYDWDPIWCPGAGHLLHQNEPELMYYQAISDIEDENYTQAEAGFQQIIAEFPQNKYAQASLKGLFALNPAIHDDDYTSLKTYCDSLKLNPGDSLLGTTAGWLSIHCDIKNQHFQQAINSLDSVISDPGTLADSIFALIDLNYVYLKALDSNYLKSSCITKNEDILGKTAGTYYAKRRDWIELLMKDTKSNQDIDGNSNGEVKDLKSVQFTSVHPNPTSDQLIISYKVSKSARINLSLYSLVGQQIINLDLGTPSTGEYSQSISLAAFHRGIYVLTFSVNGVVADRAKVVKEK